MVEASIEKLFGLELPIPLNTIFLIVASILGIWAISKKKKEILKEPHFYTILAILLLTYTALQSAGYIPAFVPLSYVMFGISLLLLISSIMVAYQARKK